MSESLVVREDMLDFPTGWEIQKSFNFQHHPKCSSIPGAHPLPAIGLLCDCGAVEAEWKRLVESQQQFRADALAETEAHPS